MNNVYENNLEKAVIEIFEQQLGYSYQNIPNDTLEDVLKQIVHLSSPKLIENNKTFSKAKDILRQTPINIKEFNKRERRFGGI